MSKKYTNISFFKVLQEIHPEVHYTERIYRDKDESCCCFKERVFTDWQIQFVLCGGIEYFFPRTGGKWVLTPGYAAVVLPGICVTESYIPGELHYHTLHFLPGKHCGKIAQCISKKPVLCDFDCFPSLFSQLNQAFCSEGIISREMASALTKAILLDLLRPRPETKKASAELMAKYLTDHMTEHPRRAVLAEHFHYAPEYVDELFRKSYGISPGEYLNRALIHRAYDMLCRNRLSIKETAESLGFGNQFYFSRLFRQIYGFPPSKIK